MFGYSRYRYIIKINAMQLKLPVNTMRVLLKNITSVTSNPNVEEYKCEKVYFERKLHAFKTYTGFFFTIEKIKSLNIEKFWKTFNIFFQHKKL